MGNTDFDKDAEKGGKKQADLEHDGRQGHGQGGSPAPQADKDGKQQSTGRSDAGHKVGHDKIASR